MTILLLMMMITTCMGVDLTATPVMIIAASPSNTPRIAPTNTPTITPSDNLSKTPMETKCSLDCNGRGYCEFGSTQFENHPLDENGNPFDFHNITNVDNMYCQCDVGFTGFDCRITSKFCDDTSHVCYHGGECVVGYLDSTNEKVHVCDCRKAFDDNGISYIGIYCERSTNPNIVDNVDVCSDDGTQYCINGGNCVFDELSDRR
jgi:hypothetical protein